MMSLQDKRDDAGTGTCPNLHPIPTPADGQNQNQPGNGNNVPGSHKPDGCTVVDGVPYSC
jgi:hypothetical protein